MKLVLLAALLLSACAPALGRPPPPAARIAADGTPELVIPSGRDCPPGTFSDGGNETRTDCATLAQWKANAARDQQIQREGAMRQAQFERELLSPNAGVTGNWAQMTLAQRRAWLEHAASALPTDYVRCDPMELDQYTTQWSCMGSGFDPPSNYLVHSRPGPGGSWVETSP